METHPNLFNDFSGGVTKISPQRYSSNQKYYLISKYLFSKHYMEFWFTQFIVKQFGWIMGQQNFSFCLTASHTASRKKIPSISHHIIPQRVSRHIAPQTINKITQTKIKNQARTRHSKTTSQIKNIQIQTSLQNQFQKPTVNNCQQPHFHPQYLFAKAVFCEQFARRFFTIPEFINIRGC